MKKSEATQHSKISAWIRYFMEKYEQNVKVELKHSRGKTSMPYDCFEEHQLPDLISFQNGAAFIYKFPDTGYERKPVDFLGARGGVSFVAVRFPKVITIINIDRWLAEEAKLERKSITVERAEEIAFQIIKI